MPDTPNLALPLLAAAQAQKHVTHNEALAVLDALVHLAVEEVRSDPPAAPEEGARYLVDEGAAAAFAGRERSIALWDLGAWRFLAPRAGWRVYVKEQGRVHVHDGAAWRDLGTVIGALANLDRLGVGTSADATNRLAAKVNAALFTALGAGEGGSGDLRFVLNKEGTGRVVSQLYQSGFGGRAETGLIGDDDFTLKVSPDGGTWREALRVSAATGEVLFPSGVAGLSGGLRRNLLINPDFSVNQRGFVGGALAAGVYGYDRWKAGAGGCTLAVAPDGTATLSGTLAQVVEAPRLAGRTVTVSVRDPTGPVAVEVAGVAGAIGAGAGRRSVTLQLPGAATGNVLVLLSASGAAFVQPALVVGEAPPDEDPMPPGLTLALCQRYFEKSYDLALAPGSVTTAGIRLCRPVTTGQTVLDPLAGSFAVRKRAVPTVTWYSPSGLAARIRNSATSADLTITGTNFTSESSTGAPVLSAAAAAGTLLQAHWTAEAEL
jgi:hypothetical protein